MKVSKGLPTNRNRRKKISKEKRKQAKRQPKGHEQPDETQALARRARRRNGLMRR